MIRHIKNIRLLVLLLVLVIIYGGLKLFSNTNRSKTFRENLVNIDTSKVSRIVIQKSGEPFEVVQENETWKVSISAGKKVDATESSVRNALGTLMRIKPDRIATRDPEKWKDYQVDSAATRVQVFEGNKNTLDLFIGRFGVQGQRQFHTFVRLEGDDEVYAANDFMGMSFPSDPSSFRNTRFLQMETDSIYQVTFQYPADSSFILNKQGEDWYIGEIPADSAQVADFLSDLRYISSTEFVDDVDPSILINPTVAVELLSKGVENVSLEAYSHPRYGYIFHSSYNPKAYFSDEKIFPRIFSSMEELLNPAQED